MCGSSTLEQRSALTPSWTWAINCFGNQLFEKLIYCLFVFIVAPRMKSNWILLHVQFSGLVKNREGVKARHRVECG